MPASAISGCTPRPRQPRSRSRRHRLARTLFPIVGEVPVLHGFGEPQLDETTSRPLRHPCGAPRPRRPGRYLRARAARRRHARAGARLHAHRGRRAGAARFRLPHRAGQGRPRRTDLPAHPARGDFTGGKCLHRHRDRDAHQRDARRGDSLHPRRLAARADVAALRRAVHRGQNVPRAGAGVPPRRDRRRVGAGRHTRDGRQLPPRCGRKLRACPPRPRAPRPDCATNISRASGPR